MLSSLLTQSHTRIRAYADLDRRETVLEMVKSLMGTKIWIRITMQKSDMLNLDQEDLWHFENNNTIDPVDRVGP